MYLEAAETIQSKSRIISIITFLFEEIIQDQVRAFIEILIPLLNFSKIDVKIFFFYPLYNFVFETFSLIQLIFPKLFLN